MKANRFELRIRIRGVRNLAFACTSVFADVEKFASVPPLVQIHIICEFYNNTSTTSKIPPAEKN